MAEQRQFRFEHHPEETRRDQAARNSTPQPTSMTTAATRPLIQHANPPGPEAFAPPSSQQMNQAGPSDHYQQLQRGPSYQNQVTLPSLLPPPPPLSSHHQFPTRQQQFQALLNAVNDYYRVLAVHRAHEYEIIYHAHALARNLGLPLPDFGQPPAIAGPAEQQAQAQTQMQTQQQQEQQEQQQQHHHHHHHHHQHHQQQQAAGSHDMTPPPMNTPFNDDVNSKLTPPAPDNAVVPETPAHALIAPKFPATGATAATDTTNTSTKKKNKRAKKATADDNENNDAQNQSRGPYPLRRPLAEGQWWSITAAAWAAMSLGTRKRYSITGHINEDDGIGETVVPACDDCARTGRLCRVMKEQAFYRGCGVASADRCTSCLMKKRKCSLTGGGDGGAGSGDAGGAGAGAGAGDGEQDISLRGLFEQEGNDAAGSPLVSTQGTAAGGAHGSTQQAEGGDGGAGADDELDKQGRKRGFAEMAGDGQ